MGPSKKKRAETGKAPVHRRVEELAQLLLSTKRQAKGGPFPLPPDRIRLFISSNHQAGRFKAADMIYRHGGSAVMGLQAQGGREGGYGTTVAF